MAKKWMQAAFGAHPGALHKKLHVAPGEKIPAAKLSKAKKKAAKTGDTHLVRQVALAETGARIARSGQDSAVLGCHGGPMGGHAGRGR